MDQREFHLQPLGICYKVYHFITKTLASHALKTVTLGHPTRHASTNPDSDKVARPEDNDGKKVLLSEVRKNDPCIKGDEKVALALPSTSLPQQARPPKKMVSINENVEEIVVPSKKKKKKRSKSFQKSTSLDQEEEEEPKPLRSILKVGSDLNDKSSSVC